MKAIGIIPARFASTRFPGKPLALIAGKPMIAWVYENAKRAKLLDDLVVATDDERIFAAVEAFGGRTIMTSIHHTTGTERVFEAASHLISLPIEEDVVVINIQGDEPLIDPALIDSLVELFVDPTLQIATAVRHVKRSSDEHNQNEVKVVRNKKGQALYFSRASIPFVRNPNNQDSFDYWIHVGIYAYRYEVLQNLVRLEPTYLESIEQLEQLRWLEHGYQIHTIQTTYQSIAVDIPRDIIRVEQVLRSSSTHFSDLS